MTLKISYFVLFGIVTIANGRQYQEDSYFVKNEYELQKLLQALANQGKYEIALTHHEDSPRTHHEDKARVSHHDEKPSKYYYRNDKSKDYSSSSNNLQALKQLFKNNGENVIIDNNNGILQTLLGSDNNKLKKEKELVLKETDYDNADDIIDFLSALQKNNRNVDKRDYIQVDNDRYANSDGLRCKGNNCARSRGDENSDLKYDSKLSKKLEVTDDLDAVVLGVSDANRLLAKLTGPKQQRSGNKLRESLLNSKSNDKKSNVEAVILDLTQVEDGEVVAKKIKQLLSQNNEAFEGDYEDYGNLIEEHVNNGDVNFNEPATQSRATSKILPHNERNNNVYVPQWLLDEVISKSKLRDLSQSQLLKSMFPLTRQQKARLFKGVFEKPKKVYRRNLEQDVGVPFHLEVQGLGQVNP